MAKKAVKPKKKKINQVVKSSKTSQNEQVESDDDFDFGGLPKNVPFKRNIGCGG